MVQFGVMRVLRNEPGAVAGAQRAAAASTQPRAGPAFHYRLLEKAELARVNELYNGYYAERRPLEEALWLYAANPNGAAVIYAAFDEAGKLAGMRPSIPYRVWWRGQERTAYKVADALVDPRHQRRGIFSRLVRNACEWAEQAGYPMISLPNENSLAVYVRHASLQVMGDSVTVAKPLAWIPYARYLASRQPARAPAQLSQGPRSMTEGPISLTCVDRFDHDFTEIQDELVRKGLSFTVRTRPFLQWRYFGSPVRKYRVALVFQSGELRGYVVIRTFGAVAQIVDFFVHPDADLVRSFRLTAKWAKAMGAIAIHFSCAGNALYTSAAMKAGYWLKKRPRRLVVNRASTLLPGAGAFSNRALVLDDVYLAMGDFDFF